MTYNGWNNYETWLVNLWLTNDQGGDERITEMVNDYHDQGLADFSDALKEHVEELVEIIGGEDIHSKPLVGDLIGAALSEVDWYELASTYDRDRYEPGGEDETESDEE